MAGSTGVVIAAMIANGGIAILKFVGFLLTGSPSMLAETYHSVSDTGNQVLLLIGIKYSQKDASEQHPFGYGKSQFFYAFLVSVLLFGVAGWKSLTHGLEKIRGGGHEEGTAEFLGFSLGWEAPVDPFYISVAILLGGIAFETYAFLKARGELRRQMSKYGWSGYREAFERTSDLSTLTAFVEDTVALLGLFAALAGIVATRVTGNPVYDSISAVLIGVLLMAFAVALAIENKRLLLGESLPAAVEADLRAVVEAHDGVTAVKDFRTMYVGVGRVLVTGEVAFDSGLSSESATRDIDQIERALKETDDRVQRIYLEPEL
ncbi:cation diffusion facilitator family transporter [Halovenus aranensis]|jgi:cation diffusion facilitator family transporter|uniref:Cation diffusion facilitator family transporter n=1 Tax=Halovenus aranensis TaxID=890420 RepID=A0A1G8YEY6_9EURY|nr:cation diffusion facilitator family transporter [Halovenus aranensis]SDK00974.1 cation diffusion facilitator family transporter [Halovenus aranensis]